MTRLTKLLEHPFHAHAQKFHDPMQSIRKKTQQLHGEFDDQDRLVIRFAANHFDVPAANVHNLQLDDAVVVSSMLLIVHERSPVLRQ